MTVEELIAVLQKRNPKQVVVINTCGKDFADGIYDVKVLESAVGGPPDWPVELTLDHYEPYQ